MKQYKIPVFRDVKHIVLHCTGTRANMLLRELDRLPYHFLITRSGRLISIKPIAPEDSTVEVAWLGGIDRFGKHVDNRTEEQKETLFNTLIVLTEKFTEAQIIAADDLYLYGFPNPGFDIKQWLGSYVPAFLEAA